MLRKTHSALNMHVWRHRRNFINVKEQATYEYYTGYKHNIGAKNTLHYIQIADIQTINLNKTLYST